MTIQDNGDGTLTYTGLPPGARAAIDREAADRAEHAWRTAVRPGQVNHVPTAVVPRRRDIDAAVTKCVDDYLLMERKARAWDALAKTVPAHILPLMENALVSSR